MKTLALLAMLTAACATDDSTVENQPKQHMPETSNPTFTLYVSNQSFTHKIVDIHVYIDHHLAVSGDFDVGSQHTWHEFKFKLAQGTHAIRVESDDVTVTLDENVTIDVPKFGVIDYWLDPQNPEEFDFFSSTEQPYFD